MNITTKYNIGDKVGFYLSWEHRPPVKEGVIVRISTFTDENHGTNIGYEIDAGDKVFFNGYGAGEEDIIEKIN